MISNDKSINSLILEFETYINTLIKTSKKKGFKNFEITHIEELLLAETRVVLVIAAPVLNVHSLVVCHRLDQLNPVQHIITIIIMLPLFVIDKKFSKSFKISSLKEKFSKTIK